MITNLRELFYDRNPGDARVSVGSERKFASSPNSANVGQRWPRRDRGNLDREFARGGPPKSLLPAGSRVPKRAVSVQEQSGPGMQGSSSVRVQVVIVLAI